MNRDSTNATVVVVDDDLALRESLGALISTASYRYWGFASAEDLLSHAFPSPPCCLLLDIDLPGMSGLELQRALAARALIMPIVFLSGHSDMAIANTALKHGAVDFLHKPVDPLRLLDRIGYALRPSSAKWISTR